MRCVRVGLLILAVQPALAQASHAAPGAAPHTTPVAMSPAPTQAPWQAENEASMARMNQAMQETMGGATEDEAFVRSMLPHHQGAIDMARTELAYGRDPVLRRMAQRIVATQQQEIMEMRAWLLRHQTHG